MSSTWYWMFNIYCLCYYCIGMINQCRYQMVSLLQYCPWYFRILHFNVFIGVQSINLKSIYYWNTQYRYFWFCYFRCAVSRHNKILFLFNFSLTRPPKKNKQQIESYLHPGKNPVNNNIYLMDDFQPSSLLHLTKLDIRQYRNVF